MNDRASDNRGGGGSGSGSGGDAGRRPRRRRSRGRGRGRGRGPRPEGGGGGGGGGGEPTLQVEGVLQIGAQGYGFLRSASNDYNAERDDPFVTRQLIESAGLEAGLGISGLATPARGDQGPKLAKIETINGRERQTWEPAKRFKDMVAEPPAERIRLETEGDRIETRVVDLISPIGKGQRCLVVAPPKAGKTVLLQQMAGAITTNHPEIHLIVLLIDERPEEVTDMRRTVQGEVIASSSDEMARNHVQVAEIVMEHAKRLVEDERDVVVLLDSITRLSRAYNTEQRGSGRVLSGGIDSRTMEKPRRFFGAARNVEHGGSLTVVGTAIVDTGSRMDEVIFQEFKGTGNTEIMMDRKLFENRIFPAIDISQTGTRREELLYDPEEYQKVTLLRRALSRLRPLEAMQMLVGKLKESPSNAEFLKNLNA